MRNSSGVYYLHADHLGTASLTTGPNSSQAIKHQVRHYPFGQIRWQWGADVSDYDFTGQRADTFGLLDYRARFYDPLSGRFVSADTVVGDFAEPQDLNRYSYVRNNPVRFTDPTGHYTFEDEPDDMAFISPQRNPFEEPLRQNSDGCFAADACRGAWDEETEAIVGIFYEPADWAFTLKRWARGDFHWTDTLGLLPVVSVGMVRTLRYADDFINPSMVRYSQNSAGQYFKDGRSVLDLAEGLRNGTISPDSIPPVRIFERDNVLWTLDNRRLAAFEMAGVDVPYTLATAEEIADEAWKFTTKNYGQSIRIRGANIIVGGGQ